MLLLIGIVIGIFEASPRRHSAAAALAAMAKEARGFEPDRNAFLFLSTSDRMTELSFNQGLMLSQIIGYVNQATPSPGYYTSQVSQSMVNGLKIH